MHEGFLIDMTDVKSRRAMNAIDVHRSDQSFFASQLGGDRGVQLVPHSLRLYSLERVV